MATKEIIYQYTGKGELPKNWTLRYFRRYLSSWDAIFLIDGKEVVVKVGDYLIEYKRRLYYYPREIYEARANKKLVGRREK